MNALLAPALTALQTPEQAAQWLRTRASNLQTDSRRLQPGQAFIAWPGAAHDARLHVLAALQQGAAACLMEAEGVARFGFMQPGALTDQEAGKLALYQGLRKDVGAIASAFYQHPSAALDVIAITGTNGKTSTAWWLAQALAKHTAAGAGMVGTLGIGLFKNGQPALQTTGLTTPDPVTLQHHLRQWADAGVQACVMEASSIGVEEHRLDGTQVHTAVFTNFTQDHLDYHADMAAYWQAKRKLFGWPGLKHAVINVDDAKGEALAGELQAGKALDVWTLSCAEQNNHARLQAHNIHYTDSGLAFEVQEHGGARIAMQTALIGHYNVANMLGVLACLRTRGLSLQQAADSCAGLQPVPGRMQCIQQAGLPLVAVDYSHTPDALEKALQGLRPLADSRGGRLWCVFGCGGDRDPVKRPLMGAAAARLADIAFITSDNPRSEVPASIMAQIRAGVPANTQGVREDENRATAIATAIADAADNDVILIAGKGHEDYQEVHGVKRPFSDMAHAQSAIDKRGTQAGGQT